MKLFETMSQSEKIEFWAETQRLIRSAIAPLSTALGPVFKEVIALLESNESGLALELTIDTLVEEDVVVSAAVVEELRNIAERMAMEPTARAFSGLSSLKTK